MTIGLELVQQLLFPYKNYKEPEFPINGGGVMFFLHIARFIFVTRFVIISQRVS